MGAAYGTFVWGEMVLEGFLGWSVWVKSQNVAKKVQSSFFEFFANGGFL